MQKESVRSFKNDLRSYRYKLGRIVFLDTSIEAIYDRLGGVRGIDPSKEPMHSQPDKEMEYRLRDRIERLEAEKTLLAKEISYIDSILMKMKEDIREAVKTVYVERKPIIVVCQSVYLSPTGLKKRMDRAIERALEE